MKNEKIPDNIHNINTVGLNGKFSIKRRGKNDRRGIGARVEIATDERQIVRWTHAGGGYLSTDQPALLIGLGTMNISEVDRVTVQWPGDMRSETWTDLAEDGHWLLVQGTGELDDSENE